MVKSILGVFTRKYLAPNIIFIMQKFEEKPKFRVGNLTVLTHRSHRSLKPIGLGQSTCEDQEHVLYLGKSIKSSAKDRFLQDALILITNVKKKR